MHRKHGRNIRPVSIALRTAATGVLVAALGGAAYAQSVTVTPNDPRPTSGWTILPMFTFGQSSDNNVTLAGEGTPRTSDALASLSPAVDVGYLAPLTTFNAGYSGSAVRYFSVNQLDTFDQRLYANFKRQVAPHVRLFGTYSAGWMPTTDTVLLAGVPFVRIGSRIQTVEGGGTIQLSRFTDMSVGYRFEWVNFDRTNP